MRVISGKYKGRPLAAPKGIHTRPTGDRVKEAVFSMIQDNIIGSHILDLFSGSGALSIESLSRGAESAVALESDPNAYRTILKNKQNLHISDELQVRQIDALQYIKQTQEKFDIVFIDPPYESDIYNDILHNILKKDILYTGSLLIIEHSKSFSPEAVLKDENDVTCIKHKKYGNVQITILKCQ